MILFSKSNNPGLHVQCLVWLRWLMQPPTARRTRANARKPPDTLLHGIAVGVQSETELAKLHELGFDGATGPGVKGCPRQPIKLSTKGV